MAVHYLEGISCVLVQDMQTILYITLYASTILEYEGLRLLIKSSDSGLIPVAKKGPLVVHFQVCMVPLIDRVLNLGGSLVRIPCVPKWKALGVI
jgi:hypothetical protein